MIQNTTEEKTECHESATEIVFDATLPKPGRDQVIRRIETMLEDVEAACEDVSNLEQSESVEPAKPETEYRLSIIVPVFNERRTLPLVLERIDQVMPEGTQTIVVDDASNDGTAEWLTGLAPRDDRTILIRQRNHGKGSAVRLGIRHSRGQIVAIQDADTEYDPVDLLRVIQPIESGDAKVVYGSRYLDGSDDPSMLHRLGNWGLTAISNCMTGQRLTDMETCHKAFDGDLVRSISIRECRFGFEPEITGKIAERGVAIAEVSTGYQYRSYEEGKKITWKDGVAALACMWRYRNPGWPWRAVAGLGRVCARLPRLIARR